MDELEFDDVQITYSKKRKFWFELKDIFAGVAFPVIISVILSATIIAFAATEDLSISLVALIGGEAMFVAALIIFGRANGSAAYKKTKFNEQKRKLGVTEECVVYRTGEYALWKAAVIGLIVCVPFLIFQTIELCCHNTFTSFCLQYICAWAYYPFSYLGEEYQALNYVTIILPVGVHIFAYYLGKLKQIKIDNAYAQARDKKRGRK